MVAHPYDSFGEWERDMARIRACPSDAYLLIQVRDRVKASSKVLQRQVHEYLQDVVFDQNPIVSGQMLAHKTGKVLCIRDPQDPWFYV